MSANASNEPIFFIVYFEGNGFNALGDWFGGVKSINKSKPYINQTDALLASANTNRASIIYNAKNQSFLDDLANKGYVNQAIYDLLAWAKSNIPVYMNTIVDADAITNANAIEKPQWSFYEHKTISYEQETNDITVEIGNIAEKVFTAIRAYGGDFTTLAELAKGITLNIGLGMKQEKGTNEFIKQVENNETKTVSYIIIKFDKSLSEKKIKIGGIFSSNKKASRFSVDYSIFNPKNAAARKICDILLDTKIRHKINYLLSQDS